MMFKVQFAACAFFYLDLLFFFLSPQQFLVREADLIADHFRYLSLCYYTLVSTLHMMRISRHLQCRSSPTHSAYYAAATV